MTLHANVMKKLVNFYHQFRRQTLDKQTNRPHRTSLHGSKKLTRDHSFKMYATFSEKLTFLTPWYPHVHLHTYICVCSKCMISNRKTLRSTLWIYHFNKFLSVKEFAIQKTPIFWIKLPYIFRNIFRNIFTWNMDRHDTFLKSYTKKCLIVTSCLFC